MSDAVDAMRRSREELVREYFRRVDRGDPALMDLYTDDVEVFFPKYGTGRGKPDMAEFAARLGTDLGSIQHDIDGLSMLHSDDRLVVEGTERGTNSAGVAWPDGVVSTGRFCNVFTFADDLISSVHIYVDPDFASTHTEKIAQLRPDMSSKTALVIRHLAFEDLGILEPLLRQRGYAVRYIEAGIGSPDAEAVQAADILVVLGGPIGIGDLDRYPFLTETIETARRRLAFDRPTLGICLGAQIMAAALGAQVWAGPTKEIGFAPLIDVVDPLNDLSDARVLHWHGDTFDLPPGAKRLASTHDYTNQAFAVGRSLALQFHLEADPGRIEQWLIGHSGELAGAGIDPRTLRADAAAYGPALVTAGTRVFSRWLDIAGS